MSKYDCDKTIDFVHELTRLCNTDQNNCDICPVRCYCEDKSFVKNLKEAKNAIMILQYWSDKYPEPETEPEPQRDLVEVVRCNDCVKVVHFGSSGISAYYCTKMSDTVCPDDFCSYGKRRDGKATAVQTKED